MIYLGYGWEILVLLFLLWVVIITVLKSMDRRLDEIFYDPEKQARTQAEKLALALSALGVEVEILYAPDGHPDPGDMPQDEADDLMLDLFSSVM